MKQLTFAELAQMLQKATGKTQQATVDTLFDWAFKKGNESVRHQPIAISMVKVTFINMFTRMAMRNVILN
ncbi:hypothetical protein [Limosilactobacillus reuteri]